MDAPVKNSRPIVARIRFAILATISVTAGFTPLVLFLARPFWLVWISTFCGLIYFAFALKLDPGKERPLTTTEMAAVTVAALSEGSIIGVMLFLVYGALWLVI